MSEWFQFTNAQEVASPALLLYPDRIAENIRRMIQIAGGAERLRPHVKTHKLPEVVKMHLEQGIRKFKCATIAEAEMTALAGAPDILLAYPPVGPNMRRIFELVGKFPATKFACVADDAAVIRSLAKVFEDAGRTLTVYLDIDCGQHRTGVAVGPEAVELYRLLATMNGLNAGGLHAYDGHIDEPDLEKRREFCRAAFDPVKQLSQELKRSGFSVPRIVAGGTPSFPLLAKDSQFECSPGTCVLWDFGYSDRFGDMDFQQAALILSRVISKPGKHRLCVDAGHKAIAAEKPQPRIKFLNLPEAEPISHSEEHLVIETPRAHEFAVGDCLYGVPRHICPTVALHSEAVIIREGHASERWKISARERRLTI